MGIDRIDRRPHLALLAPLLACALLAGCGDDDASPTAPTTADDGEWFAATATHDTYLDDDHANTNYGQSGVLRVGPDQHALLQFDLQALPADAVITDLRLRLTQSADDDAAAAASVRVTWLPSDGWDEDTATADDAPSLGSEVLGDLSLDALSSGRRPATFASAPTTAKAHHDLLYGNRIVGLRLSSNQQVTFLSGEHTDPDARPGLDVTYADGTRVFLTAEADATVSPDDPTENFNDRDRLYVNRGVWYTYVKFDLSSLPEDATLELARLRMLANDGYAYGGDGNVYSYLVEQDFWTAATITANNAPDPTGEHLGYWWLWYDGTDRDAWGVTRTDRLRPAVQAEHDGDGRLSLRLNSPGYFTSYYRTTDPDEAKRPVLEIVYTR